MDIYAYLRSDHRRIAKLVTELLDIRLPAIRQTLFEQIRAELSVHAAAEERTFYRTLVDAARDQGVAEKMARSEAEHDEIRELLDVLSDTPVSSDFWLEKFGELKHAVEHHVQEEEGEVFELAPTLLDRETALRLGNDMDALKTVLLLEPA
ncbi:MAG TPA: hemerythrin domain-containing protein [Asticcacaulis sp.]|nr:hemerythrin domain-containing protein [Asticcacaulis sp.]